MALKKFQDIAEKLETSKSHAQVLVRKGISLLESENSDPRELHEDPLGSHQGVEGINQFPFPQNIRPESFTLETDGIPKRIVLTPKALMIYNIWQNSGFDGDLSDFLEDAVVFLYETRKPAERGNYG